MDKYIKISEEYVEEIKSKVVVYRHIKTGARVCCIENDDNNKVFTIAFRTPAINSTGVTHIIEHTVLCGSKKYPMKDPFMELIKGSPCTFINAFTYPDKTCYPVASQNLKDIKNMMDVYMDAVFHPNIYSKEEIFHQEGWRYEIFDKKDPLIYNGVVFNEMKGALSNPDDVLSTAVSNSLFPHTCYHYESGGDPKHIPDLTYQDYLDFHKKYYNPANSFIYLYGNFDMEERMKWIDEGYLSKIDKVDFNTELQYEGDFKKPKEQTVYYSIGKDEGEDKKTSIAFSCVLKDNKDVKLALALSIINTVLIQTPGSLMKKAILDTGLGESISSFVDDGLAQTMMSLVVKGTNLINKDKLVKSIIDVFTKASQGGLDHKAVLSMINNMSFKVREGKFSSTPRGLDLILSSLNYWLYDETAAVKGFKSLALFEELKKDLNNGFFEDVIEKYILKSKHSSIVVLLPSKTIQERNEKAVKEKLAALKSSLTDEQLDDLVKQSKHQREYQMTPSSKEDIATLPTLTLEDLKGLPDDYPSEIIEGEYKTYYQEQPTNGINYCGYYFDISKLPNKYLPYVSLLATLLRKIKTDKRSESELTSLLIDKTGSYSVNNESLIKKDGSIISDFSINYSALNENMESVEDLTEEIIAESDLSDLKTIYQVLCTVKNNAVSSMSYNGHMISFYRALSHQSEIGYLTDIDRGIAYLDFNDDLVANFDKKKDEIVAMLKETAFIIFAKNRFFAYYTGEKANYPHFKKNADRLYAFLKEGKKPEGQFAFVPDKKNEGIRAPFDVVFNSIGCKLDDNFKYNGAMMPLNNVISNDYLWNNVRVKGGAYGCFMISDSDGVFGLASYRDPNLKSTVEVFKNLPSFIKDMNYSKDDILKFTIASLPGFNKVMHVSDKGKTGFLRKLTGRDYQTYIDCQNQLLATDLATMKSFNGVLTDAVSRSSLVSFGNGKLIDENKDMFDTIRDLIKN